MPGKTYPQGNAVTEALIRRRKLGTRDANLARGAEMPSESIAADRVTDMQPANIIELANEIQNTRDPRRRALLMAELQRIKGELQNLVGPIPRTPEPGPFMRMPYAPNAPGAAPEMPQMTVPMPPQAPPVDPTLRPNANPAMIHPYPEGGLGWRRG